LPSSLRANAMMSANDDGGACVRHVHGSYQRDEEGEASLRRTRQGGLYCAQGGCLASPVVAIGATRGASM
jgi:hypothetical protein